MLREVAGANAPMEVLSEVAAVLLGALGTSLIVNLALAALHIY